MVQELQDVDIYPQQTGEANAADKHAQVGLQTASLMVSINCDMQQLLHQPTFLRLCPTGSRDGTRLQCSSARWDPACANWESVRRNLLSRYMETVLSYLTCGRFKGGVLLIGASRRRECISRGSFAVGKACASRSHRNKQARIQKYRLGHTLCCRGETNRQSIALQPHPLAVNSRLKARNHYLTNIGGNSN
jgi:hypothetical protein